MRELIPNQPVQPGAGDRTGKRNGHHAKAAADLRKERARTGAGNRPAKSENQSAKHIPPGEFFFGDGHGFPLDRFDPEFFDQPDGDHAGEHGRSDHAIHMDRLKSEHLLNPEPGDHLRFDEDDAK